jgi:hypothetical protein
MEASDGVIRGNADSLMKLIAALDKAGLELIGQGCDKRRRRTRCAAQVTDAQSRDWRRTELKHWRWPSVFPALSRS